MNIIIINHYAVSSQHVGGTRHHDLARELKKSTHHARIIAGDFNHFDKTPICPEQTSRVKEQTIDGIAYTWLKTPSYQSNSLKRLLNMLCFSGRLLKHGKALSLNNADVIIGSSPDLFSAYAAYRLAKRYQKPFVLEIRDLWPETLTQLGRYSHYHPFILCLSWLEKKLYRKADHILILLPQAKEYLLRKGAAANKITYAPNFAIALPKVSSTPKNKKAKYTFIYVGSIGLANNLNPLIEAVQHLQNSELKDTFQLRIIGEGPEKAALQKKCKFYSLTNVIFGSAIAKEDVPKALQEADAGVIITQEASLYQWGFSFNKLFDYLSAGIPVAFVGDYPFAPIRDFDLGVTITSHAATTIAEGMKRLMTADYHNADFIKRSRQFLSDHHHVSSVANSIIGALQECIKVSEPKHP